MPFDFIEETADSPTFDFIEDPIAANSPNQQDKTAMAAALAESNLRSNEEQITDTTTLFTSNRQAIQEGREELIRSNISALEQQKAIEQSAELFDEAIATGDSILAQGSIDTAREAQERILRDAIEFNALDTFRADTEETESEKLDNTQAILAAEMLANKEIDEETNIGIFDKAAQLYTDLQRSANEHGNSLKTDIVKGVVNGVPAMLEGVADNINKLLPDAYWELLAQGDVEEFKKQVMTNVDKDTLPKFEVGDVGKFTEVVSAVSLGMAAVVTKIPKATSLGLTGLRFATAGTIADVAILDGMDSATEMVMEVAPSTRAPITEWLADRDEDSPWENKAKQAIEAAGFNLAAEGLVFGAIKAARGLKHMKQKLTPIQKVAEDPIKMIDMLGDTELAADVALSKVTDSDTLHPIMKQAVTVDNAIEAVTPTTMKTHVDVKQEIGLSGAASIKELQKQSIKAVESINETIHQVNRLQGNELDAAVARTQEEVAGLFPDRMITDISVAEEQGVNVASMYLSKKGNGTGYVSESVARNQSEGIDNVTIVKQDDGLFYPMVQKVIKETNMTEAIDFGETSWLAKNAATRFVVEPADFLPNHLLEDIGVASNARAAIRRNFVDPLVKRYTKNVTQKDFQHVNDIAAIGRDAVVDDKGRTGKWFNREEFDIQYNRLAETTKTPDTAWDSYKAYREINDLQYAVENNAEYIRKATMGTEEIHITTPDFSFSGNGIVKEGLGVTDNFRVYSLDDKKVFAKGEIRATDQLEKYETHKIVQLENSTQLDTTGEVIKYLLVKPADYKASMLDPFQVSYREGGRVVYTGKYFSKQASTTVAGDGSVVNLNPLTHYTSANRRELVGHTTQLENARNAYRSAMEEGADGGAITYFPVTGIKKDGTFSYATTGKQLTKQEADEIISKTALVDSVNMSRIVEEGGISLKHPFEVRGDREVPVAYDTANSSYIDENHSGASTWLVTNKKKKFASRGERLRDPQEKAAAVVDPHQTAETAIESIINHGMAGNYTTRIANQFTATAKSMGFLKPEFANASPQKIFSEGKNAIQPSITGATDTDYQGLITTLESMQRGIGYKSTTNRIKDAQINRMAEYFDSQNLSIKPAEYDEAGNLIQSKVSRGLVAFNDSKPLQKANNFLYTTQFGLNAAQFFTQGIGGAFTTAIQDPKKALQAMGGAPIYALHFLDSAIPKKMKNNKQLMNLLGWDNGKEFDTFVNHMSKSGYIEVHNSQIDIAKRKANTGKKGVAFDLIDQAIDKSTIAMETGEMLNQVVAYKTAYLRYKDLFPKADINSTASTGWIIREADKLTFNMKSSVQSNLAKNEVSGVIMRFKNFFWKVFQANTVGGKRSNKEKAAFWGTTTAAFGTGTNMYTEWAKTKLGIEDEKTIQLMENGAANFMFTDADGEGIIDVSNTIDPRGIGSLFADMTDPDTKLIHWMTGALGAKAVQVSDQTRSAVGYVAEVFYQPENVIPLTQEAMFELSKISTGWTNTMRGYHAFNTGNLYSRSETPLVEGMSKASALSTMFGFKTTEEMAVYNNYGLIKSQSNIVKSTAKEIFKIWQMEDKQDKSTEAGRAKAKMYRRMAKRLLNTPYKDQIEKQIDKKQYFAKTPQAESSKETLEERREQVRDFDERN